MVGDVLVIGPRRVADLQAARARPGHIHSVVTGGETGDQSQVRQAFGKGLVDRKLAGDHQGPDHRPCLERWAFPEFPDGEFPLQQGRQHAQVGL